jgi:cytochrome b561
MESKGYNVTHRLLHWSIGLSILVLIGTALLHITWLGNDNLAKIMLENIIMFGGQITAGDASILAKRIAAPMWEWHFYAGYALVGLYILRLIHLSVYGVQFPSPFSNKNTLKQRFQGSIYIVFYLLLGITTVTGALMIWGPTSWRWTSQIIHYQSHYYAMAFVILHFGGITVTELFMEKGVASKMIHG